METACAPFFYLQANTLLLFTLHLFFGNPCVYRHSEGWRVCSDSSPTLHHSSPIPKTNRRKLQRKTARRPWGGCVISLNNSWRITVDHRMHITCCACAYQLLCKRTTAVVRPKIQTASTTYPSSSNNIFLLFQQHILTLPTTRKGWIINLWHILRRTS